MSGRNDVNAARTDFLAVLGLTDLKNGVAVEQLGQQAFVVRVEVLDDHKGQFAVLTGGGEHIAQRFEPTRGGSDPDNEKRGTGFVSHFIHSGTSVRA